MVCLLPSLEQSPACARGDAADIRVGQVEQIGHLAKAVAVPVVEVDQSPFARRQILDQTS
jgi:putative N-acetylmannosamine-6-phosphate epimerase